MGETTTLSVHRCRFVDFTPSAITALAFPPLPLPSIKGNKKRTTALDRVPTFGPLVVGHANGNIDIYEWTGSAEVAEAPQAWVVRKVRVQWFRSSGVSLNCYHFVPQTLSGVNPSKVDSLALTLKQPNDLREDDVPSITDLRLFSTGGGSELTEWDMVHATIRVRVRSILARSSDIPLCPEVNTFARRVHMVHRSKPCFNNSRSLLRGRIHPPAIPGIRHPSTSSPS